MAIRRLNIVSVRNHKDAEFYFSPGVTVIWGENGSGKTAILEAINILSFGKSFKTHRQRELINIKTSELFIRGEFCAGGQEDVVAACVDKKSGQIIKLNGKKILSRKELLGRNIVVVLSPEEQGITMGAPSIKRSFFDRVFSVISPGYLKTLQQYGRALKQRNIALIQFRDGVIRKDALETWTEPLAKRGAKLWKARKELMLEFKKLQLNVSKKYDAKIMMDIKNPDLDPGKEKYREKIEGLIKKDIFLGRTGFGPHRDNITINWFGKNIKVFGSQGEHKLCLVILKLTELFFIKEKTGITPALLLDDLFSKLDLERSKKIVHLLQGLETIYKEPVQTIVTTTDLINVENSGLLSKKYSHKTYHLER
tara:strand:+ start:19525 stop:20625 length:1101 start_codon:yes stop_codon:yes gene_type:complete